MEYALGVDVGSISTKAVLFNGDSWQYIVMPTGFSPREAGDKAISCLLDKAQVPKKNVKAIIGTGYGRVNMPYADKTMNELSCHGRGAHFLFPQATGVIDIGGQDSKVMRLSKTGKVADFLLNDKCAAGTGRFLQVTAQALGVELDEIDQKTNNKLPIEVGSMCAVFAETEVLNLIVQGNDLGEVLAGVLQSIAVRMAAMATRILGDVNEEVVFTGGLANSKVLIDMLTTKSGWLIKTPDTPQITGALGAAVVGYREEWK